MFGDGRCLVEIPSNPIFLRGFSFQILDGEAVIECCFLSKWLISDTC